MNVFLQTALVLAGLVFLAGVLAGVYWAITGHLRGPVSLVLMMLGIIMFGSALFAFSGPSFDAPQAQQRG